MGMRDQSRWLEERIYRTRAGNEPGGVWARRAVWEHGVQAAGGRRQFDFLILFRGN
jgi:hypothetical protein